jgi:lipopolysaccharide/colanic/teichoic acid biosynthesis glycosyltransferase
MKRKGYFALKRVIDLVFSLLGLVLASPILVPVMFLVWHHDRHSPFYVAERVGKDFIPFKMVKLRSMVKDADSTGVDSTSVNDMRITPVGQFIRKCKLDELTQLWNVLKGDMSLVGPRPNVKRETDLYTNKEKGLLAVKPGITDFASIIFSDEGDILAGQQDPDVAYNQLIRPGKSKLGLTYLRVSSTYVDIRIIAITAISIVSRQKALLQLTKLLKKLSVSPELIDLSTRRNPLLPMAPPGTNKIVTSRKLGFHNLKRS